MQPLLVVQLPPRQNRLALTLPLERHLLLPPPEHWAQQLVLVQVQVRVQAPVRLLTTHHCQLQWLGPL